MTNPKKIIITGASGMLGAAFRSELGDATITLSKQDCDVTDRTAVLDLARHDPEAVIHCAANVNADECERLPDECRAVQVDGTLNVIELANACGAKLLYPQSFLIFDGQETPITEETFPNPLSWYGKCKLDAAVAIQQQCRDYLVIQMGGFFGGGPVDKNFVGKFVPHLIQLIRKGHSSVEIGDRVWQPTYTRDLARNCITLLQKDKSGVFNMASHGSASFFDLATECVELLNLSERITVVPVSAEQVQKEETAARPASAIMDNRRLKAEGLDLQRPWQAALADYLKDSYFLNMVKNIETT